MTSKYACENNIRIQFFFAFGITKIILAIPEGSDLIDNPLASYTCVIVSVGTQNYHLLATTTFQFNVKTEKQS